MDLLTTIFQNVTMWITGTFGKTALTLTIIIEGLMLWAGHLSKKRALYITLGVVLVFGASWIAQQFFGE